MFGKLEGGRVARVQIDSESRLLGDDHNVEVPIRNKDIQILRPQASDDES